MFSLGGFDILRLDVYIHQLFYLFQWSDICAQLKIKLCGVGSPRGGGNFGIVWLDVCAVRSHI